ncbi:MAG: hypothetical protein ACYDH0_07385 [Candidatus Aminicenantales bacterium]
MNDRKPGMIAPALIGGAVAGILSGLPFLNCMCCLWVIGGAALASFLLAKDSPVSLTAGDGAIVGTLSGISAAVVDSLIGLPLRGLNMAVMRRMMERMSEFSDQVPSGWESWLNRSSGGLTLAMFFMGLFFSAAVFAALGALGGIIGASLFGKKIARPPADVPPSQAV